MTKYKSLNQACMNKPAIKENVTDSIKQDYNNKIKTDSKKSMLYASVNVLISMLLFVKNMLSPVNRKEKKILKLAYKEKNSAMNVIKEAKKNNYNLAGNKKEEIVKSETSYTLKKMNKDKTMTEVDFNPESLEIKCIRKGIKKLSDMCKIKDIFKFNEKGKLSYYGNNFSYTLQ